MRPLRYSINLTLDGCCDHRAGSTDEELHRYWAEKLAQAEADWMEPFARTVDAAKKYVVSSTLDRVDWNAELVRGDLGKAVQQLKRESGRGLFTGGVKLPQALAELGLIDEYEFVVQPRLAGHGPTLFAGLSKRIDLKLVSRLEFGSGAVALRYEPRR
jgi:dihydrofolate reductase